MPGGTISPSLVFIYVNLVIRFFTTTSVTTFYFFLDTFVFNMCLDIMYCI